MFNCMHCQENLHTMGVAPGLNRATLRQNLTAGNDLPKHLVTNVLRITFIPI